MTLAFWKGHSVARYVRSLAPLTPLTRSAALRSRARSLRSLPRGTVVIHKYVFMLRSRSKETNAIVVVTRHIHSGSVKMGESMLCFSIYLSVYLYFSCVWLYVSVPFPLSQFVWLSLCVCLSVSLSRMHGYLFGLFIPFLFPYLPLSAFFLLRFPHFFITNFDF